MPPAIMASFSSAAGSLFSSPPPPPPPHFNDRNHLPIPPPPLSSRRRRSRSHSKKPHPKNPNNSQEPTTKPQNPAFRAAHARTHYHKPVHLASGGGGGKGEALLAADPSDAAAGRAVVVGPSGVSFRLPDAPFDFQYSYSEVPRAAPLAIREPAFLPFAPPSMPRPWTGKAPLLSKNEKARKKGVRLFAPLGKEAEMEVGEQGLVMETRGKRQLEMGMCRPGDGRSRREVLGRPLSRSEVRALVKPHLSHNRQVNLGRDGLTHNMLEMIHCHWRRQEICKVRCRGVPTVDMDNICHHLEEKSGGKIIYRVGGVVFLFRGRHYDPRTRPRYPVMLWKPAAPVYPKLIQEAPEGLTRMEADDMRQKGQKLLPICKLAKNGIYINLVKDVRDAFEGSELVKIDCEGMHASDYKKLGAKLKELVPCVLLSFDNEQILMYRGKEWKSMYLKPLSYVPRQNQNDMGVSSDVSSSDQSTGVDDQCTTGRKVLSPKMLLLWKRAIDSFKALLLDETEVTELTPDSLLKRVEEFDGASQAVEHSYPALLLTSGEKPDAIGAEGKDVCMEIAGRQNNQFEEMNERDINGGYLEDFDSLEHMESSIPLGSLPVDSIAEKLGGE